MLDIDNASVPSSEISSLTIPKKEGKVLMFTGIWKYFCKFRAIKFTLCNKLLIKLTDHFNRKLPANVFGDDITLNLLTLSFSSREIHNRFNAYHVCQFSVYGITLGGLLPLLLLSIFQMARTVELFHHSKVTGMWLAVVAITFAVLILVMCLAFFIYYESTKLIASFVKSDAVEIKNKSAESTLMYPDEDIEDQEMLKLMQTVIVFACDSEKSYSNANRCLNASIAVAVAFQTFEILYGVSEVIGGGCQSFCMDGVLPVLTLVALLFIPVGLSYALPMSWGSYMATLFSSRLMVGLLIYLSGEYKFLWNPAWVFIPIGLIVWEVILSHAGLYMVRVHTFVQKEIVAHSAIAIERSMVLDFLAIEANFIDHLEKLESKSNAYSENIRETFAMSYNPLTLQFYNPDSQLILNRHRVGNYSITFVLLAITLPSVAAASTQLQHFSEGYLAGELHVLHYSFGMMLFASYTIASLFFLRFSIQVSAAASVISMSTAERICEATRESSVMSLVQPDISNQSEARDDIDKDEMVNGGVTNFAKTKKTLRPLVRIDKLVSRAIIAAVWYMLLFVVSMAFYILSRPLCVYTCIDKRSSFMPIYMMGFLGMWCNLVLPVPFVATALIAFGGNFVLMFVVFHVTGVLDVERNEYCQWAILLSIALFDYAATWFACRLHLASLAYQEALAKTLVGMEEKDVHHNYFWYRS